MARLFWQAFRRKLHFAMRPKAKTLRFTETVLTPRYALNARDGDGTLLGVAGLKPHASALIGADITNLHRSRPDRRAVAQHTSFGT